MVYSVWIQGAAATAAPLGDMHLLVIDYVKYNILLRALTEFSESYKTPFRI